MADDANSTFVPDTSNVVTHPREQLRQLREKLAQAAQQIIDALDALDDDPDLEPSLGSLGASVTNPWATIPPWAGGSADDREDEFDDRELTGDECEPNLGAPENHQRQLMWAQGNGHEREEECEDEGAQCDDEGHDSDTELNGDETDYSQSEDDGPVWYDRLREDRLSFAGRASEVKYLEMDKAGNVSFELNGHRWIGGRLTL